jgi:capsid protein
MPTASAAPVLLLPSGHPAPIAAPRSTSRRGRGTLAARYDAAQTTADNRNHWAAADSLSPDAAANPFVRKKLRDRSRYEAANNCNLRRMLRTQAKGIIGTGPRLQMLTPDENLNRQIEKSWQLWAKAVNFSAKLRTMRETRAKDGEVFATITNNPGVRNPIKVDINLHEADMITSDILTTQIQDNEVDGIKYDRYGNPAEYRLLKYHPGSQTYFSVIQDAVWVKAKDMIHYFIEERPGQHRGVPEITPALPLFAQLRRYTLAVISAAETAADFSAILYTDASPDEEAEPSDPFDEVEIGRNTMTTMPMGWKMSQFEPTQPTTAYSDFKREIINDIAGVLELPYNVAAGNSSDYNYASGRLDFQDYYKTICVDREFTENSKNS